MAIVASSNFTDYEKNFFITEAVVGLTSVEKGLLYVVDGEKEDQYTFPRMSSNPVLKARATIPTSTSTTTLDNLNVTLDTFEVYEEFDPIAFENHWHHSELAKAMLGRPLPPTFTNYMASYYTQKALQRVEELLFLGSKGYTTSAATEADINYSNKRTDGLIRKAVLSANTLKVGTPAVLTSANILAKMDAAIVLLPKALRSKATKYKYNKFIISPDDEEVFAAATANLPQKGQDIFNPNVLKYKGYVVEVAFGMPKDTFFFGSFYNAPEGNMHLVMNAYEDMSFEINKVQNNADVWFYKMRMKLGVGIAKDNEFVIHTTKVAGDFTA